MYKHHLLPGETGEGSASFYEDPFNTVGRQLHEEAAAAVYSAITGFLQSNRDAIQYQAEKTGQWHGNDGHSCPVGEPGRGEGHPHMVDHFGGAGRAPAAGSLHLRHVEDRIFSEDQTPNRRRR